jgi:hypothetical protein
MRAHGIFTASVAIATLAAIVYAGAVLWAHESEQYIRIRVPSADERQFPAGFQVDYCSIPIGHDEMQCIGIIRRPFAWTFATWAIYMTSIVYLATRFVRCVYNIGKIESPSAH